MCVCYFIASLFLIPYHISNWSLNNYDRVYSNAFHHPILQKKIAKNNFGRISLKFNQVESMMRGIHLPSFVAIDERFLLYRGDKVNCIPLWWLSDLDPRSPRWVPKNFPTPIGQPLWFEEIRSGGGFLES